MEVKTGKKLKEAVNYQRIAREREKYAGEDCLTVVDGNHVVPIGEYQEYDTCLKFIIAQLADDPEKLMVKGHFTDAEDMYGYLFENCNDEQELTSFLCDYWDGMEMENYERS